MEEMIFGMLVTASILAVAALFYLVTRSDGWESNLLEGEESEKDG